MSSSFYTDHDPTFEVIDGGLAEALRRTPAPLVAPSYSDCGVCLGYFTRRHAVLAPTIAKVATRQELSLAQVIHRFMKRVHARHVEGLPL